MVTYFILFRNSILFLLSKKLSVATHIYDYMFCKQPKNSIAAFLAYITFFPRNNVQCSRYPKHSKIFCDSLVVKWGLMLIVTRIHAHKISVILKNDAKQVFLSSISLNIFHFIFFYFYFSVNNSISCINRKGISTKPYNGSFSS